MFLDVNPEEIDSRSVCGPSPSRPRVARRSAADALPARSVMQPAGGTVVRRQQRTSPRTRGYRERIAAMWKWRRVERRWGFARWRRRYGVDGWRWSGRLDLGSRLALRVQGRHHPSTAARRGRCRGADPAAPGQPTRRGTCTRPPAWLVSFLVRSTNCKQQHLKTSKTGLLLRFALPTPPTTHLSSATTGSSFRAAAAHCNAASRGRSGVCSPANRGRRQQLAEGGAALLGGVYAVRPGAPRRRIDVGLALPEEASGASKPRTEARGSREGLTDPSNHRAKTGDVQRRVAAERSSALNERDAGRLVGVNTVHAPRTRGPLC